MSTVVLGNRLAQLDVRMNGSFPPLVPSGTNAAMVYPTFGGCGSPGNPCPGDSELSPSVQAMRDAVRGTSLNGLMNAYLGEVSATTRDAFYMSPVYQIAAITAAGASAYHGYKRSGGSVGWTIGWFLLGSIFPIITVPVALAQGFGKRKA